MSKHGEGKPVGHVHGLFGFPVPIIALVLFFGLAYLISDGTPTFASSFLLATTLALDSVAIGGMAALLQREHGADTRLRRRALYTTALISVLTAAIAYLLSASLGSPWCVIITSAAFGVAGVSGVLVAHRYFLIGSTTSRGRAT